MKWLFSTEKTENGWNALLEILQTKLALGGLPESQNGNACADDFAHRPHEKHFDRSAGNSRGGIKIPHLRNPFFARFETNSLWTP
jgi:hypothetical protein